MVTLLLDLSVHLSLAGLLAAFVINYVTSRLVADAITNTLIRAVVRS